MVRTQIQLTEPQAERLHRLAAARGVSMASLIRDAVDVILATADGGSRAAAAIATVGRYDSGTTGTARDHDAIAFQP